MSLLRPNIGRILARSFGWLFILYPIVAVVGFILGPGSAAFFISALLLSPLALLPDLGGFVSQIAFLGIMEVVGVYLVGRSTNADRTVVLRKAPLIALGIVVALGVVVLATIILFMWLPYNPWKHFGFGAIGL